MVNDRETITPELKTWSFENFGQVLKISGSLEPEVFPYQVSVSKDSTFFKGAYNGVYKGEGVTVYGSEKRKHPIVGGAMVEHMAVLAANDLGEVMLSKEVFEGNLVYSLTKYSQERMANYNKLLSTMPLPPGWRRFGNLHSHPILDVTNSAILSLSRVPKVDGVGVTWSGGDFKALVEPIWHGYKEDMVMGVITPVQLAFMVATHQTIEILKEKSGKIIDLLKVSNLESPPYDNFAKLGIVLYAGNHIGLGKNFDLRRLI